MFNEKENTPPKPMPIVSEIYYYVTLYSTTFSNTIIHFRHFYWKLSSFLVQSSLNDKGLRESESWQADTEGLVLPSMQTLRQPLLLLLLKLSFILLTIFAQNVIIILNKYYFFFIFSTGINSLYSSPVIILPRYRKCSLTHHQAR